MEGTVIGRSSGDEEDLAFTWLIHRHYLYHYELDSATQSAIYLSISLYRCR